VNAFEYCGEYLHFLRDYLRFKKSASVKGRFDLRWSQRQPCLKERLAESGFDRHYVYHTAWAARCVASVRPSEHVDISSSLYFCSIASAFVPVRYLEFRPPDLSLENLAVQKGDLLHLPFEDGTVASLSCMHVIEHVGLGRYGDPIDPDGDLKAIEQLKRVSAAGGMLLFVVPVGKPRILFNAHRVYTYEQICGYFSPMRCVQYAFIPDSFIDGPIVIDPQPQLLDRQQEGCGCFWFTKEQK
jgi:SAM-dependent methyltransferase